MLGLSFAFPCCADDLATAVVGRWAGEGNVLEFYPQNIGKSVGETTRCFKFDFPTDGQVVFRYGAGAEEQCAISMTNNELRLSGTNGQETVFTKVETNLNPCLQNLHELDCAMALFALDHDGMPANGPRELVPAYLSELPVCPGGGIYNLTGPGGHASCTVSGHCVDP